jgi:hypothetical protein
MATPSAFSAQILGQTEKALNAILARRLDGTGLTEPLWVALNVTLAGGGTLDRDELAGSVAGVLRVSEAQAQARVAELIAARLVQDEGSAVTLTDSGRRLYGEIRADVTRITERLWGDLPAEHLEVAGRVLGTVLARADAELAGR